MIDIDLSGLQLSAEVIVIRMAFAMLIGAVIGVEREFTHRPAGLRTHMLVALGACTVMITSQMLYCQYRPYGTSSDPARLSAQVIAGVGFLGAGTILREGVTVKGLTTAASIWSVACLGIAAGAGYYTIALVALGCILITLTFFEWLQRKVFKSRFNRYTFTVRCVDVAAGIEKITTLIQEKNAKMSVFHVEEIQEETCLITFVVEFAGRRAPERHRAFVQQLSSDSNYASIKSEIYSG